MARHKLTTAQVRNLPPGKFNDGGGLWLHRRDDGGAQWFLRVTVHGRRREMGLGSIDDVSLADARRDADRWRSIVREGRDPIKERERLRREAQRAAHTLEDVLSEVMARKRHELKSEASWQRWDSPLRTHILPKLGKIPIAQIDGADIANALRPIWHEKASTARKTINRLGQVLTHAAAMGLDADLQAVAKARALLGRQRAVARHHEAMAWKDVPAFWQSLGGNPAELALKFLILTAVRSAPVRFMTRAEVIRVAWSRPSSWCNFPDGLRA